MLTTTAVPSDGRSGDPSCRWRRAAHRAVARAILSARRADRAEPSVTDREREILELLRQGLSNKEIAGRLGITVKTVKAHLTSLFTKIGVLDRTQAALWAERFATKRPASRSDRPTGDASVERR